MPEWFGTAAVIAVIVVICVFAVIGYVKKLSKGCCGTGGDNEKRIGAKQETLPVNYTVEVGSMFCEKCAVRVENAFNKLEGVSARVLHKTGLAEIGSEKELSELIIRKTIVDLGYTAGAITKHN